MLYINSFVSESNIHWLWLFAGEKIPKWTLIGEFVFWIDISLSSNEYENLEPKFREFFDSYGWKDKISGKYMLNVDNTRFINHSKNPNILHEWYKIIAAIDIDKWNELLDDYSDFDDWLALNHLNK